MANQEHLDILKQGVEVWNKWRKQNPEVLPDLSRAILSGAILNGANLNGAILKRAILSKAILNGANLNGAILSGAVLRGANLSGADLSGVNLSGVNLGGAILIGAYLSGADLSGQDLSNIDFSDAYLSDAYLSGANFSRADLSRADLNGANLSGAILSEAILSEARLRGADLSGQDLSNKDLRRTNLSRAIIKGADLSGADLIEADLSEADLSEANLSEADLSRANLIRTNLTQANLSDCIIYGISVWDVQLDGAKQFNLTITPEDQPTITVDNLKIAQFIYLLLRNEEIRDVINTLTTKSVLILGRFTPERKAILDAMRDELRNQNYLPLLFDFDQPISRGITETVTTLARLVRFIIADLTDAKSIPQELAFIVPDLPSVPVQPLLLDSQREWGMFEHFTKYPWVLPVYRYTDEVSLLQSLKDKIIAPAEQKALELAKRSERI